MDKIAVLIPCYNESKTVEKVVSDFRRVLPDATVYVYDNNSTDGTAELAAGAGAVVRHEYQQGKGNVMRRMFREIDAEAYILVDGDDTYPAEAAPEMVAAVTGRQADMVVGDGIPGALDVERRSQNAADLVNRAELNLIALAQRRATRHHAPPASDRRARRCGGPPRGARRIVGGHRPPCRRRSMVSVQEARRIAPTVEGGRRRLEAAQRACLQSAGGGSAGRGGGELLELGDVLRFLGRERGGQRRFAGDALFHLHRPPSCI